jgi:single-stranded-DNA-specific exonuclease
MEIKNLEKAAKRISRAIKNGERIILYGDADLDGVSSVIILKETIKNLNGKISAIYFPDRENEGYGITKKGLMTLKNFSPALFIAFDLGIGNFKEVKIAKKFGFEVIIIDHHEILDKLPQVSILVDPKQKGDKYPFKGLATAGISFKLSRILLGEKLTKKLRENFLELVALATIADMMPRLEENQLFIEEGLESLRNTWRPGLKAFFSTEDFRNQLNLKEMSQKIISSLNASDKIDHLNEIYLLLTEKDERKAEDLAKKLLEKGHQRQIRIREIVNEIEEKLLEKMKEKVIFEGSDIWSLTLLGGVASRICKEYQTPTFLFKIGKEESQGAVRVPAKLDSVKLMQKCSKFLETYGGHPQASGFRIKNKNLEKFKECLIFQIKQLKK